MSLNLICLTKKGTISNDYHKFQETASERKSPLSGDTWQDGGELLEQSSVKGFDCYNQNLTDDVSMTVTSKRADPHHVPCAVQALRMSAGCHDLSAMTKTFLAMARKKTKQPQNATGVMGVAINNNEGEYYGDATKTRALQVLLGLRNKIGENAFQQWAFGRLIGFQKEEILQQELYEQSLQGKTEENKSELDDSALSRTEFDAENALLGLWKSAELGYPPYRQELAQQFVEQLDLLMQKLSYQNTPYKNATVRRLLPIETERLMGFPDNHTRIPWKGKPEEECPDAPRYKACGNSMCVNVMEWIGLRIQRVENYIKAKMAAGKAE